MRDGEALKTPRNGAKFGMHGMLNGEPVALVKSAKNKDYLTAKEAVEVITGRRVKEIIFYDDRKSA